MGDPENDEGDEAPKPVKFGGTMWGLLTARPGRRMGANLWHKVTQLPTYFAGRLGRRDRRQWLFGNHKGYRDSPRYLAEHIAAAAPIAVDKDQVPPETVETERRIFVEQVRASGKPENMIDKIVEGKIQAYYKDVCLLHQAWVREPKKTVGDLVREVSAKTGENVQVRRFTRYQLGEA